MLTGAKTRGHGLIQAWPMYTPEGDIIYGLEERGDLTLEGDVRGTAFWTVANDRGIDILVPFVLAVVTWDADAVDVPAEDAPTLADTVEARGEFMPEPPRGAACPSVTSPYSCPHCHQSYARKVDALVCEHRCDPAAAPWTSGSCDGCGYPLKLHALGVPRPSDVRTTRVPVCEMTTGEQVPYSAVDAERSAKLREHAAASVVYKEKVDRQTTIKGSTKAKAKKGKG